MNNVPHAPATKSADDTMRASDSGLAALPQIPDHELLRCIGSGAYGDVWLAKGVTGVFRAVKVVHRKRFKDERPFDREFTGVRNFEPVSRAHDGLVDVLHVGRNEERGYFYYVMELADAVDGSRTVEVAIYQPRTLRAELTRHGRLSVDECVALGLTLTSALDHLHSHGLIHRDIKLSNIVYVEGVPKLADIGLVAASTDSRSYVGTEGYIPPEGPGTPQADLYSLGKVLYESMTGKDRAQFPELPSASYHTGDSARSNRLNEIILTACEENVRNRYQTAAEMHAELQALHDGTIAAPRRVRSRRNRIAMAVIALLACLGLGVVSVRLARSRAPMTSAPTISEPRLFGYRLEGDEVVFEFDLRDYDFNDNVADSGAQNRLVSLRDIGVTQVSVPGEFNMWSTEAWQMSRVDDLRFELRKKRSEFSKRPEWQFKFLFNNRYWLDELPANATNQKWDSQDKHINLVLRLQKTVSPATEQQFGRHPEQGKHVYGYRIEGDEVIFEFDTRYYKNIGKAGEVRNIRSSVVMEASVAGEFNSWSPTEWKMDRLDQHQFILRKKLADLQTKQAWRFIFIVNGAWTVASPHAASNRETGEQYDHLILNISRQPAR